MIDSFALIIIFEIDANDQDYYFFFVDVRLPYAREDRVGHNFENMQGVPI